MEGFIFEYIQDHSYDYNDAIDFRIENLEVKGDELKVAFSYRTEYCEGSYRLSEIEFVPLVEMLKDIYNKL